MKTIKAESDKVSTEDDKKYIVIGLKQHGKDTLADYLRDVHGYRSETSSLVALKSFLYERLNKHLSATGLPSYETVEDAYENRGDHRPFMFSEIERYNKENPSRLAEQIFKDNDVYCGLRSRMEFNGIKKKFKNIVVVWVDASERLESGESTDSNELTKEDADIVLTNNDDLKNFHKKSKNMVLNEFSIDIDYNKFDNQKCNKSTGVGKSILEGLKI